MPLWRECLKMTGGERPERFELGESKSANSNKNNKPDKINLIIGREKDFAVSTFIYPSSSLVVIRFPLQKYIWRLFMFKLINQCNENILYKQDNH